MNPREIIRKVHLALLALGERGLADQLDNTEWKTRRMEQVDQAELAAAARRSTIAADTAGHVSHLFGARP